MEGGNKVLWVFTGFEALYLGSAVTHLVVPLTTRASLRREATIGNVAPDLLLEHCPLTASLTNSIIMFGIFLVSLPAIFIKTSRTWLIVHAWGVVVTTFITLGIGLRIWFDTLETHKNLEPVWNKQEEFVQSLLQVRFSCCGYNNPSLFIRGQTCPTATIAAQLGPCTIPFSSFANHFLDVVFTASFGFCAINMLLLLATMCLIKDRKDRKRFRKIEMKLGAMQVL
ncbi:uncharacterized protein HMPREF1541_04246 [Cyphellophora europaea CBS 101466]|uniref:Tetraspanin n=1 Tax=Cyphellophora europaea (strain CBS 101466) TaxID=1220924 RepID=W2S135_CYPE1|nr:uncharacterized protein HMPREF1541_04246 [Cyphellophora europaea CBS 101466]ETN42305.1 hypothetical protein HMPREF1541_04246 [Cyphellophora europaea CBS 101466]